MNKTELRKKYKEFRSQIKDREGLSHQILENLIAHFDLKYKVISVFIPIIKFKEIDTWLLINQGLNLGCTICVSRSDIKSKSMKHFFFESKDQLKENEWGIMEPSYGEQLKESQIDIVLVPLLAYDQKGNRIGYGGGFYDRFLSNCKSDTIKIGLSFFPPEKQLFDIEETDIPLNFCVTPTEVYEFAR